MGEKGLLVGVGVGVGVCSPPFSEEASGLGVLVSTSDSCDIKISFI
jgi:hypothetical protein